MHKLTIAGTVLAFALAGPAFAQNNAGDNGANSGNGATQSQSGQTARLTQHLRNDLQKAGFSNVRVMPESFLVRAKDSQGHPVMMVINPDSMTEVTALGPEHSQGANGSEGQNGSSGTSAETNGQRR